MKLSLTLSSLRQQRKLETARKARDHIGRIQQLAGGTALSEVLSEHMQSLGTLLPSDGFGLYLDQARIRR